MTRKVFAGVLTVAVLAVLTPENLAGPPDGVQGRMTFDEVGEGLRQSRTVKDAERRISWLKRLARTGDPRVAEALVRYLDEPVALPIDTGSPDVGSTALKLLEAYYMPPPPPPGVGFGPTWPSARIQFAGPSGDTLRLMQPDSIGARPARARAWWKGNEADLLRRARELPR